MLHVSVTSNLQIKQKKNLANIFLFIFFQLIVFVNENAENKVLFVTQFVFYLMVLFVHAANKGKATHGKTNRVLYIFSGSCWSYVKDLYWDTK